MEAGYQAELSVVRDTLAARDATIAQVLNSLGSRGCSTCSTGGSNTAKLVPMLEARANQLEPDLRAAQTRAGALLGAELAAARAALQAEQKKSRGFDQGMGWKASHQMKTRVRAARKRCLKPSATKAMRGSCEKRWRP